MVILFYECPTDQYEKIRADISYNIEPPVTPASAYFNSLFFQQSPDYPPLRPFITAMKKLFFPESRVSSFFRRIS